MQWQQHSSFEKEYKKICKKQNGLERGFEHVKKLLAVYFDPIEPSTDIIDPGKIHRLCDYTEWQLWKIEVMIVGLKTNLWPRVWFAVSGNTITFLVIGMHNTNYDDNTLEKIALERYDY